MRRVLALSLGLAAAVAVLAANAFGSPAATRTITIVHVTRGCHSWKVNAHVSPSAALTLRRGATLRVVDQDVDAHRLVQLAGPKIRLGGAMMMNHGKTLVFQKAGLYRFTTRVVEMAGMPEVKTIGPDHTLLLTVRVR